MGATYDDSIKFGNFSNSQDFSNLFGGSRVFNLGAGSSTSFVSSLTQTNTDSSRKDLSATGGGFGLDLAASVGVGIGGDGSAGAVEKHGAQNVSAPTSGTSPFMIGGVAIAGLLAIYLLKKR